MKTVRILLADDHKVVRQGTRALLSTIPEWEIVGEADNGRDAVALTVELKPDIVILDITMPELNGLDAARQIKRKSPQTEILIFTAQETEKLVHDVFDSGARSYIMKTDAADHLIDAIKALSEHKHYFTSRISEIVFARCIQGKQALEGTPKTAGSPIGRGKSCSFWVRVKVVRKLPSSWGLVRTVETHRAAIMKKLGLKSFSALIRYAVRNKIIEA